MYLYLVEAIEQLLLSFQLPIELYEFTMVICELKWKEIEKKNCNLVIKQ